MSGRGMSGFRLSGVFLWVAIGVPVVACDDDSDALGERGSSETDASDAGSDATLEESGQCGNGRIDTFDDGLGHYGVEGCDDGNRQAGDGCSASCSVEDGFECNDERPQNCTQSPGSLAAGGAGGNAGSTATPSAHGGGGAAGFGGGTSISNGGGSGGQGGDGVGGQGMGATSNGGMGDGGASGFGGNGLHAIGTGGAGLGGSEGSESQSGGAGGDGGSESSSGGAGGSGGSESQSGGAGGSGPGPEGCPNDDPYTLPMDQTLLIAAECNAFDVAGEWTCTDDGVRPSGCVGADPVFRDGEGMCLSGSITDDPTFAAWGAQLGATLAGSGGQSASFNASAQGIVGFSIAITGSTGGATLRISFESANSGATLPFIEVPGPGTYDVLFDDAIVPLSWMVPESGAKADPSALAAIHVRIVGGDQFANYDFCVESMRALGENLPEP